MQMMKQGMFSESVRQTSVQQEIRMFEISLLNLKMTQFPLLLVAFHQFGTLECDHKD